MKISKKVSKRKLQRFRKMCPNKSCEDFERSQEPLRIYGSYGNGNTANGTRTLLSRLGTRLKKLFLKTGDMGQRLFNEFNFVNPSAEFETYVATYFRIFMFIRENELL